MRAKSTDFMQNMKEQPFYYRAHTITLFRPLTLTGTLTPILAISGIAAFEGHFQFNLFAITIMTSLFIQAAINTLNDYFDFLSGQDSEKWTIHQKSHGPAFHHLPIIAAVLLVVALLLGIWLVLNSTISVLFTGVLGVLLGVFYSAGSKSLSSIGLGELTAAFTMGTLVPWTTYFIQSGELTFSVIVASLPFSFIIAAMILTNNIRDLKKDIGFRKTVAMRLGRASAVRLLSVLLICPYIVLIALVWVGILPKACLLVVFALPIATVLRKGMRLETRKQINIMKWAGVHHWAFGLLYAISIWLTVWIN